MGKIVRQLLAVTGAAIVAWPAICHADSYALVGASETTAFLIDFSALKRDGVLARGWELMAARSTTTSGIDTFDYVLVEYEINCVTDQERLKTWAMYRLSGEVVQTAGMPDTWSGIVPESAAARVEAVSCGKRAIVPADLLNEDAGLIVESMRAAWPDTR